MSHCAAKKQNDSTDYVEKRYCLDVNLPELFMREDFNAWLSEQVKANRIASWHNPSEGPCWDSWSDTFMFIELHEGDKGKGPSEGSNSDMPEPCWILLGDYILENYGPWSGMVHLTNLG